MNNYTNEELEIKLKKYLNENYPEYKKPKIDIETLDIQANYYIDAEETEEIEPEEHWFDYMKRVDDLTSLGETLGGMVVRECLLNSDTFKQRAKENNIEVIKL